jgi:hypothetical protein
MKKPNTRADNFLHICEGFKLGRLGKSAPKKDFFSKAKKEIFEFKQNEFEITWKEWYDPLYAQFLRDTPPSEETWNEYDFDLQLKMESMNIDDVEAIVPRLRFSLMKNKPTYSFISLTVVIPKTLRFDSWADGQNWLKNMADEIRKTGLAALPGFPDQWIRYVKPDPRLKRPYIKWLQEKKREEIQWQEYVVPRLEKTFTRGKEVLLDYVVFTLAQQEDNNLWIPYLMSTSYVTKDKRATPLHFDGFKHKTLSFDTRKKGRDWIQKIKPDIERFGIAELNFPEDWESLR